MIDLTQPQKRALVLLKRRWLERGSQPNLNELAAELGIHYTSLKQHLEALVTKGYLEFESQGRGKAPILRIHTQEGIPLVGDIAAGGLRESIEYLEGYLAIPGQYEQFALRVKGDSMAELIQDGDVVILDKAQAKAGDICAIRFEDEVTLKYLDLYKNGTALLRPHNPDYEPIKVRQKDIDIAGVFHSLLRGPIIQQLFRDGLS